jgi:hypothetical protein
MKQQIDSRVAEMHLKLTNAVLDEMDRQRKRPCVRVVVDDFQRCVSVPERV